MKTKTLTGVAGLALVLGVGFTLPPPQGGNPPATSGGPQTGACVIPGAALSAGGVTLPISGPFVVTDEYGPRAWRGGEMHAGLDFASSTAAPILAVAAGTVTFAAPAGGAGNMIQIDHGDGVVTQSMHLSSLSVGRGDSVAAGQQIGVQGSTGDSTGPHLHLRVTVDGTDVNPRTWLSQHGVDIPGPGQAGTGPAPGGGVSARGGAVTPDCGDRVENVSRDADMGAIPEAFRPWLAKAAQTCDVVSVPLLAAQIEAESGWRGDAVSPAGARGWSQFMPATWAAYGRDDDGNGRVDPSDVGDAAMAQARYNCAVARLVAGVPGDRVDLMLAGYNAGPGAVLLYGGVPPYAETQGYVAKIRAGMDKYTR